MLGFEFRDLFIAVPYFYVVAINILLGMRFGSVVVFRPELNAVLNVAIRPHDICAVVLHRAIPVAKTTSATANRAT